MTKKNLRPQQVAPVQRETVTANNSSAAVQGLGACFGFLAFPFAGEDAE